MEEAGATTVATNPIVTAEVPKGQESFEPSSDVGSNLRLFDRPLFGKNPSGFNVSPDIILE